MSVPRVHPFLSLPNAGMTSVCVCVWGEQLLRGWELVFCDVS